MKTGIYWQDPEYPAKGMDFIFDPSLVLYLPLYKLDGASFMSKDAYGHLCPVPGALWTPNGRYFDGLDDFITLPDISGLFSTEGTLIIWLKNDDDVPASTKGFVFFGAVVSDHYPYTSGDIYLGVLRSDRPNLGTIGIDKSVWHMLTITSQPGAENWKVYQNLTKIYSATGDATVTVPSAPLIGSSYSLEDYAGHMGEVFAYNRALTPLEIQHNYLATKWRYQ